jgi:glycosyltransferase involved in cell wall biosynthesis
VAGTGPRVGVLEVSFSRQVWGAELVSMELAEPLARRGVDLTLAAPPGGELEEHWRRRGLPFLGLEVPERAGIRHPAHGRRPGARALGTELLATVSAVRAISRAARPFDLVRSNSLWAHLDCALAGRMARRAVALDLHDLVRPGAGRTLLGAAVRLATVSTAISEAVADSAGRRARSRVEVVPLAVDLERFCPGPASPEVRGHLSADPGAPLVGIVGRIDPEKGVDVVVRAMQMLTGDAARAHLVVVGSGGLAPDGYPERVRNEAERMLGSRVRFVGRMRDVPAVLRALDVLVNASVAEPFGMSVLEAQACGVAVVGTRAGGIPDFVIDGDNGLLVASGDADALAKALDALVTDPDLRTRLAARGRRSAEGRGVEDRAGVMAELYRRAASAHTGGRRGALGPRELGA